MVTAEGCYFLLREQKNFNVYATATLSGDVANAIALLKRMARPASRRHKAGLLIPARELASCQARAHTCLACCLFMWSIGQKAGRPVGWLPLCDE